MLTPLCATAAHADDAAPVTTMTRAGTALDGMYVSYVGCDAVDGPAVAPATRINLGPDVAPLGRRSFGLVPAGVGTASGPTISFLSLAGLGAGLDVRSEKGTSGASYIWVTALDAPAGFVWRGRAVLDVPPATWQHVDTAAVTYEWELIDPALGMAVAVETSTPGVLAERHGDGAGFVMTGFGCDGHAFNIDAVTGNDRVWDFEGLSLDTSVEASTTEAFEGEQVDVTGSVTDDRGRVTGDPLILQSRSPGADAWTDVSPLTYAGPDGSSRASIEVSETQELRWLRPESQYADAGSSEPVLVTVTPGSAAAPTG